MKRSTKPMRRTPFTRNPPDYLVRRRRNSLAQVGKKGRENAKVNREKKAEHEQSGVTYCELRISKDCTPFNYLSWAHAHKRRHMGKWGSEERAANMRESICACWACHWEVERQGEAKMMPIIQKAIERRAA